jgi:hypothetical protein
MEGLRLGVVFRTATDVADTIDYGISPQSSLCSEIVF